MAWGGHGTHNEPNSLSRCSNCVTCLPMQRPPHSSSLLPTILCNFLWHLTTKRDLTTHCHTHHSEKARTFGSLLLNYTHTHTHINSGFSVSVCKFISNVKRKFQSDDIRKYKMETSSIFCGFKIFQDLPNHLVILL